MKKTRLVSRRHFLNSLGGGAATHLLLSGKALAERAQDPQAKPRNVIFILSDDHRYDFFGFLGKPKFLKTPNFDRLSLQGAHIQNAFVTTSLCSPSRASVLTGMYPYAHGVVDNDSPMPGNNIFFPSYFQKGGYKTAFIGKWHMGNHSDEPQPGFDHWVSFPGQGVYDDPEFNVDGTRKKHTGYITDLLTDYSLKWISSQQKNPFFLYLSHKAVHSMFIPPKRHLGRYDKAALEYPITMADKEENYHDKPRWVREQRFSWHGVDHMYYGELDFDTFYRRYCETLLGMDDSLGRILDSLKELGLFQSTLVIYAGDNGFSFGEHGLIDKRHMYEESFRVPLLAHCPELIQPGTKISQFVQNVDFAPTMLDAAGLPVPEQMQGTSFVELLQGKVIPWRDAVFYAYYWERPYPQTPTMFGIRTSKHKYITYHGIWDIDELYDIEQDPGETKNLINSKEHQELIVSLRAKVFDWVENSNATCIPLRRSGLWQAGERKEHHD
ncbi:MAG: sulfatase [Ignavibacteriales bacterium]|nr:sulfatase [Ignavibacteriales bacterium]